MEIQKKWMNILIVIEVAALLCVCLFGIFIKVSGGFETGKPVQNQSSSGTEDDKTGDDAANISTDLKVERLSFSAEVEAMLSEMTLEEKAAQLFITSPEKLTGVAQVVVAGNTSRSAMQTYPVGGLIYSPGSYQGEVQFRDLISGFQGLSLEFAGVELFVSGTDRVDNPDNYGISLNSAETVKPALEMLQTGMNSQQDFIFVANETSPELTGEDALLCSFSAATANLVRDGLGYQGLIISGDLSDSSVTGSFTPGEAAVTALKAGMDVLYNPANFVEAYNSILNAVQNGEIDAVLLENAVGRILTLKTR